MGKDLDSEKRLKFVYYCSGHGYGHATRVSAVACHLLSLSPQPIVHIVSSAPQHVFSDSIALGALYRRADIDPVIVQPVAYRVDRRKSVEVLRAFLKEKDRKIEEEKAWLQSIGADCVLSDAAFLGCAAANAAGIPSVLITNFTFDSVYSYLSTPSVNQNELTQQAVELLQAVFAQDGQAEEDNPIPEKELTPLVKEIIDGYRCADLLLRLPGAIPIPSFSIYPALPSPQWVHTRSKTFQIDVSSHLLEPTSTYQCHPPIPFPSNSRVKPKNIPRTVLSAPLIVRTPNPEVYTPEGRAKLLDSLGVPSHLHDSGRTKVLLVSFGGQIFHKPHSRTHSRNPSNAANSPKSAGSVISNGHAYWHPQSDSPKGLGFTIEQPTGTIEQDPTSHAEALSSALQEISINTPPRTHVPLHSPPLKKPAPAPTRNEVPQPRQLSKRAQSQLVVAGAPPAAIPTSPTQTLFSAGLQSSFSATSFTAVTIPPTPEAHRTAWFGGEVSVPLRTASTITMSEEIEVVEDEDEEEDLPQLFPDESWLAIVCGVSKEWGKEDGEELPENFFVAPKDVYMPDLTAVADVLLGKLGYGTVSECVDACTPFVFVPRPLFIEEFGLRLLLNQEGVGVELSRSSYESGEWAAAIEEAWQKGKERKARKREEGETGKRKTEGREMAKGIVDWVEKWYKAV
ncbi:hypothetical protein EIP91_000133 [Steccherinum ochraceum]|uniref:L-arabinokinase n=1 Tax=Steccherinum ochraceum TaxID=92696 RepID=A0A4R0RSZ0_9APHY|nr:hypothetical protein EIP91_000133 [Steccherinum ochraceum]